MYSSVNYHKANTHHSTKKKKNITSKPLLITIFFVLPRVAIFLTFLSMYLKTVI